MSYCDFANLPVYRNGLHSVQLASEVATNLLAT